MDPQVRAISKVVGFLEYILAVGLVGAHFFDIFWSYGDFVNNDVITSTVTDSLSDPSG